MKIIEGKLHYQRVTEIISPFTGVEFIPEIYLNRAGERGTEVHEVIESILMGFDKMVVNPECYPYLESFDRFYVEDFSTLEYDEMILEKRLYCDKYKITGQIDCILTGEKTFIFDWKTSAKNYKYWRLQAAAYRYLAMQEGYVNVQNLTMVKLHKEGKEPKLFTYDTYEEDLEIFFKCLELFNWFEMSKTRRKT